MSVVAVVAVVAVEKQFGGKYLLHFLFHRSKRYRDCVKASLIRKQQKLIDQNFDKSKAAVSPMKIGKTERVESSFVRRQSCKIRKILPKKPFTAVAVLKHVWDQLNKKKDTRPFIKRFWNRPDRDICSLMLELGKNRARKNRKKIEGTVSKILVKYNSLRHFSREADLPWTKFHRHTYVPKLSNSKRKLNFRKKLTTCEISKIHEHFQDSEITFPMPEKKFLGQRFMRGSMKRCHKMYNEMKTTTRKIGLSTYYKYKPKTVKLQGKIPFRQSCCERCENFTNVWKESHKFMSGIPNDVASCVDDSLCKYTGHFPKKSCVLRICEDCGVDALKKKITEQNLGKIEDQRKRFLVKQWVNKTQMKEGVKQSFLHWKFFRMSYEEMLDMYCEQLESMSMHTFMASWNYSQYKKAKQNLQAGEVIMVHDFSQNYLCIHQNEPQALHWVHEQVTMMPTVVHYLCSEDDCQKLVTREIVHISEDMKHDAHLVKQFKTKTIEVLKESGIDIRKIIEFTDQAPSQYKNKTAFRYLAQSDIPTMHNFFGVRHGKGPCDACTGRVKQGIVNLVRTELCVVNTAQTFYEACRDNLEKPPSDSGECKHHILTFEMHPKIKKRPNTQKWTALPDTRKIHSVCTGDSKDVLNFRYFACCCDNCMHGSGPCSNTICPEPWKGFDLLKKKPSAPKMSQWNDSGIPLTWAARLEKLSLFQSFHDLRKYIRKNPIPPIECRPQLLMSQSDQLKLDLVALHHVPDDAPLGLAPIIVGSDGNCFPRTISYILYRTQEKHVEIRVRIIYEGVLQRNKYLDDMYISHGATNFYRRGTLVEQFAMYSDNYNPINGLNVNKLYEQEIIDICKDGAFMGIWQIFQTANVIKTPILSVYPTPANLNVRGDINRQIFCYNEEYNTRESANIMWTPMQISNSRPCHFVPLLKLVRRRIKPFNLN